MAAARPYRLRYLSKIDPELRHRNPQRADLLISGSVGTLAAIGNSLPTVAWGGKAVHE